MNHPHKSFLKIYSYNLFPYIIFVFSLLLTFILWTISKNYYAEESRLVFDSEVADSKKQIDSRMKNYEYALHAGLAYLHITDTITHKEWHEFTHTLETDKFYPGIQGMGYAPILKPHEIKAAERKLFQEYHRPIEIFPKGKRSIYSAIFYLEPDNRRNQAAIGYDMFSESVRHEAMEKARDTGKTSISGRVILLQEIEQKKIQPGILMYAPLYRYGAPTHTLEQRRSALIGYIYSPFRVYDLMHGILRKSTLVDFEIYDTTDPSSPVFLYSSFDSDQKKDSLYSQNELLKIGGRTWDIRFRCSSSFYSQTQHKELPVFTVIFLLFDFFLFWALYHLVKNRNDIHAYSQLLLASQQLYATLSQCNKAIVHAKDVQELFSFICREAVDYGGMKMAWIGIADKEAQQLQVVSSYGEGIQYLDTVKISTDSEDPTSQGPTGLCFHQNKSFWCQDFQHDEQTVLWHARGKKFGWGASASLPLNLNGEVIGTFTLYSSLMNAFDKESQILLEEMAMNISYALDHFESEKKRKKAEYELLRLSQVVEQNPYSTIITDTDGIIKYANPACTQKSGYAEEELIGKKMSLFRSGHHPKNFYQQLWQTIKTDQLFWKGTLVNRIKNGEIRDFKSTIFPLFDHQHNLINFVSIEEDITEQNIKDKLFMMQTRQAQMGEMLSIIAHQWRQPLAIINIIVGTIRLEEALKEKENVKLIEQIMQIEEQSLYLSNTITDFKDIFRPDKPKEPTLLSTIIKNTLNLIDHSIKSHGIKFNLAVIHDTIVETFPNEVLQVVITLIKNSLDAFNQKPIETPYITVVIDQNETYGTISLEDNAGGIKAEILDKIFLPYFTTKALSNGTGLGLYMSKMLIEENCNGHIEAFSDHEKKTIFIISLPRRKEYS